MAAQVVLSGVIGKGANGTVYRGKWRGLDVAVKTGVSIQGLPCLMLPCLNTPGCTACSNLFGHASSGQGFPTTRQGCQGENLGARVVGTCFCVLLRLFWVSEQHRVWALPSMLAAQTQDPLSCAGGGSLRISHAQELVSGWCSELSLAMSLQSA